MPINDLVFDLAGIDLQTWKREDMFKEFTDEALSAISFTPEVKTPEPPKLKTPEPPKVKTPEPHKQVPQIKMHLACKTTKQICHLCQIQSN
jgi:hypothetical protein